MKVMKFLPVLVVAIFVVAMWSVAASAHSFKTGNTVSTSSDEVIDNTLFTAGNTITIGSTVNGDVFCAAQTVTITGNINGDVMCAAQNITISGEVDGDVRLAGQSITLSSSISGNASILTQTLVQESGSSISGDLSVAGSDISLDGIVGRDVAVASGDVTIGGSVDRDIRGNTEDLTLLSNSFVGGSIEYTSANDLVQESGATVVGSITRNDVSDDGASSGSVFGWSLLLVLYIVVAGLIVSLLLVLLAPRFFNSVTGQAYPRPWKALLVGFVAAILAPVMFVIMLITIVGIPLAILFGVAWLLIALLSGPFSAYLVGRWIMKDSNKPVAIMFIGSLLLLATYFIPFLHIVTLFGAYWIGAGMLLLEGYRRWPKPTYNFADVKTARTTAKKKK